MKKHIVYVQVVQFVWFRFWSFCKAIGILWKNSANPKYYFLWWTHSWDTPLDPESSPHCIKAVGCNIPPRRPRMKWNLGSVKFCWAWALNFRNICFFNQEATWECETKCRKLFVCSFFETTFLSELFGTFLLSNLILLPSTFSCSLSFD